MSVYSNTQRKKLEKGWTQTEFAIEKSEGRTWDGRIRFEHDGSNFLFDWHTKYLSPENYEVTRQTVSASHTGLENGDFTKDSGSNEAIKKCIAKNIAAWREGAEAKQPSGFSRSDDRAIPSLPTPKSRTNPIGAVIFGPRKSAPVIEKPKKREDLPARATVLVSSLLEIPSERGNGSPKPSEKAPPPPEAEVQERSSETPRTPSHPSKPESLPTEPPQTIRVKVSRVRRFSGQPRTYFDEDKLGELADSLKQDGQRMPIIVIRVTNDPAYDVELVEGERRLRAAKIAGIEELNATVAKDIADGLAQHLASTICNFHREGHTSMEISNALHRQTMEGGKSAASLAVAFGKSIKWVYQHLALQKLTPRLQKLLDPPTPKSERLRKQVATFLIRLPSEKQEAAYLEILREKNLRRQILVAKDVVEKESGVSRQSARAFKASDHVEWLVMFVERLHGDIGRVERLQPSAFASLVTHHEGEIPLLVEKVEAARASLAELIAGIEKVRSALKPN
ncbi:MAG: ParB/RepB/Spo0J family partition protein [Candidatus Taylorbacteria bacterium]|nr:ParB/RepB/Spo0J family partition protein [Candidatus Taylorbacteria bacterium]